MVISITHAAAPGEVAFEVVEDAREVVAYRVDGGSVLSVALLAIGAVPKPAYRCKPVVNTVPELAHDRGLAGSNWHVKIKVTLHAILIHSVALFLLFSEVLDFLEPRFSGEATMARQHGSKRGSFGSPHDSEAARVPGVPRIATRASLPPRPP